MKNYSIVLTCRDNLQTTAILMAIVMITFCAGTVKAQSPELEIYPLSDRILFIQGPDSNVLAVIVQEKEEDYAIPSCFSNLFNSNVAGMQ